MGLDINDLETRRFGIRCARLTADPGALPDLDETNRTARAEGIRMVTARVEATHLAEARRLEADGYRLMDTLVYYSHDHRNPRPPSTDHTVRDARNTDADAAAAIARAAFADYFGHYHADPRLDRTAATEAYVDWAASSLRSLGPDHRALVADLDGQVAGFATLRRMPDGSADIALNAVHPQHQGRGLYGALVDHLLPLSIAMGAGRTTVSTQIINYAVQRIWARRGFLHDRSVYTFHKWFD